MCCCYEQGCLHVPAGPRALAFVGAEGRRGRGRRAGTPSAGFFTALQRVPHMRLHRPRANLPITPLARLPPSSREDTASRGGLDTEKLSSFSCWRPWLISAPLGRVCWSLVLRPALPSALQSSHDGLGRGHSHSCAQRVLACSWLGPRAGPPCSVSCLLAAGSHTSGQLPGARASATAAPAL